MRETLQNSSETLSAGKFPSVKIGIQMMPRKETVGSDQLRDEVGPESLINVSSE